MASVQCERKQEEVQFSSEEKASLDVIIKQAENSYISEDIGKKSLAVVAKNECLDKAGAADLSLQLSVVAGGLKKVTKEDLIVFDSRRWAGFFVKNFPSPLDNSLGTFALSALTSSGVKAGVAYGGKNFAGVECAWLLAFADSESGGRRVYVECGDKNKFNNIDWAQVEQKLNVAGPIAKAFDWATKTTVLAAIVGRGDKAVVGATFLG